MATEGGGGTDAVARRGAESGDVLLTDYRLQQRDYLLRIARAMNAQRDLREVLTLVIRSAVTMTNGQAGAITLRQPGGAFDLAASYRLEERMTHYLEPLTGEPAPMGEDSSGGPGEPPPSERSAALALPVPDVGGDEHQVLTLPLTTTDEVFGRIIVFRTEGAAVFTPLDADVLRAFADQAAVAIENASLHERLAARERQLAGIVERTPGGILLTDAEGRIVAHNPAARALTARTADALTGRALTDVLTLEDEGGRGAAVALPSGDEASTAQGYLRGPGGEPGPYVQVAIKGLRDDLGAVESFVAEVADLTRYKEAEDAKSAFLAGLSHELKTPLALIRGFTETLRMDGALDDGALCDEAIGVILAETEHLTEMVDGLLEAARVQAGALSLTMDEVDLASLLERLVDEFRRTHTDHEWHLRADPDLPPVTADSTRLRQVFQNLLSNAAKYAEKGTRIGVTAAPSGAGVRVVVRDRGIGVAEADRARIFDRFVRATDRADGTGLGLYMARAIVEAHGGTIGVAARQAGGSAFTVELPVDGAAPRHGDEWDEEEA